MSSMVLSQEPLSSHTATWQGSESRVVLRVLRAHSLPLLFQTQEEGDALKLTSDLLQLCHLLVFRCLGCTPPRLPQGNPMMRGSWRLAVLLHCFAPGETGQHLGSQLAPATRPRWEWL